MQERNSLAQEYSLCPGCVPVLESYIHPCSLTKNVVRENECITIIQRCHQLCILHVKCSRYSIEYYQLHLSIYHALISKMATFILVTIAQFFLLQQAQHVASDLYADWSRTDVMHFPFQFLQESDVGGARNQFSNHEHMCTCGPHGHHC
jgi:hypothetical protein